MAGYSHDFWQREPSVLTIWDTASPDPIATVRAAGTGVGAAAWSPTSERIAVFDGDERLLVLSFPDLAEASVSARTTESVRDLFWSPDGHRVLVCGNDTVIWYPDDDEYTTVTGHTGPVEFAAWEPDGHRLAGATHRNVWLWEASTGEALAVLREPGPVCFVGWYDGAVHTLLDDGTWHSWQVPTDLADIGELVEARPLTDEERSRFGLADR